MSNAYMHCVFQDGQCFRGGVDYVDAPHEALAHCCPWLQPPSVQLLLQHNCSNASHVKHQLCMVAVQAGTPGRSDQLIRPPAWITCHSFMLAAGALEGRAAGGSVQHGEGAASARLAEGHEGGRQAHS